MEEQGHEGSPGTAQGSSQAEHRTAKPSFRVSDWRSDLRRTIITRVVPRMAQERLALLAPVSPFLPPVITADQVVQFAGLVLTGAVPALVARIEVLRSAGLDLEAVLLQLVTPAARHLGELWERDRVSFIDVTAGISRLQGVIRALGADFDVATPGSAPGRRILLAPASGEQHVLGITMVAAFFRRAGWDVTIEPRMAIADMLALVRVERFAAIGLSVATDKGLEAVRSQVGSIRDAALGGVSLLAGGPAFLDSRVDAAGLGVDGIAGDAAQAVRMADVLSPAPERSSRR